MYKPHITGKELLLAQLALYVAIGLQVFSWTLSGSLTYGPHPLIIITEVVLSLVIGVSTRTPRIISSSLYRTSSFFLLGLISAENISSLIVVSRLLITQASHVSGYELLASALAIFLTNIIVFALWYWELDSPGLSGKKWSKHDKDFQFTQQDMPKDFPDWQPSFSDYLYMSLTNAINFAAADTKPLTMQAKALMGTQALVSVFTLALVLARSVSILGQ
jgi:uncharacterized membrane protein